MGPYNSAVQTLAANIKDPMQVAIEKEGGRDRHWSTAAELVELGWRPGVADQC